MSRRLLLIILVPVLVAVSIALYYVFTRSEVGGVEESPRALSVVSEASLACDHVEVSSQLVYLSGSCTIAVNILNNENETVIVHGIVVFYNGMSRHASIPVMNVTVEPTKSRTITGSFVLPEKTLVYDGSSVYIKVFLRVSYAGKYHSLPVESLHIDV